jgi:hypothetical protein
LPAESYLPVGTIQTIGAENKAVTISGSGGLYLANFNPYDYALWLTAILLEAAVLITMLRRGQFRNYPPAVAYVGYHLTRDTINRIILSAAGYETYFYAYWWGLSLSPLLILWNVAAIYQSFNRWINHAERRTVRLIFLAVVGLAVLSLTINPNRPIYPEIFWLQAIERTAFIICAGATALVILSADTYSLTIRPHFRAITGGFLIITASSLLKAVLTADVGSAEHYRYLSPLGFCVALALWLAALNRNEPELFVPDSRELKAISSLVRDFGYRTQGIRISQG